MSFKNKKTAKKISDPGLDSQIEDKIYEKAKNSMLTCKDVFNLSAETGISTQDIGKFADCHDIRLTSCQLGLFGIGPGKKKAVKKITAVPETLEKAITDALENGKLSCKNAWEIASRLNIPKIDVSNACETMKIKLCKCRVGAFR